MRMKVEFSGVDEVLKSLDPKAHAAIITACINKVTVSARAEAKRIITETYTVKSSELQNRITLKRASKSYPYGEVRFSIQRSALIKFKTGGNKRSGYNVEIIKGKREPIQESRTGTKAFKANMPTGHTGIYYRLNNKRLPIYEAAGRSAAGMIEPNINRLNEFVNSRFPIELSRAVSMYYTRSLRRFNKAA